VRKAEWEKVSWDARSYRIARRGEAKRARRAKKRKGSGEWAVGNREWGQGVLSLPIPHSPFPTPFYTSVSDSMAGQQEKYE
jgi:hypothetical protein